MFAESQSDNQVVDPFGPYDVRYTSRLWQHPSHSMYALARVKRPQRLPPSCSQKMWRMIGNLILVARAVDMSFSGT